MPSTYSPKIRMEIQATGENRGSWGAKANSNALLLLEEAIAGMVTVAMTDANKTLTPVMGGTDESRPMFIKYVGALTASRTITIPTVSKFYVMRNDTTGGFPLTITTGSGGGAYNALLPPMPPPGPTQGNQWKLIFSDGISVWSNDTLITASSATARWGIAPFIDATGVLDVGQKIDFHNTNTDPNDWNVRLETGNTTTDLYVTPQGGVGSKIWTALNDGSGSTLDADLLDGFHASDIRFIDAPNDGKLYARRVSGGVGAWVAIDAPWTIEVATGDVLLKFGGVIKVRIRTDGFIRTASDVQIYSTTVVSGG